MAKKKPTHQHNSTDPQNPTKMEDNHQSTAAIEGSAAEKEKLSTLKSLNAMLLKETVEKRQEITALLECKKSLESELTRSESQVEALRAELTREEVAKGVVSAFMESLRRENEDAERKRDEEAFKEVGDLREKLAVMEAKARDAVIECGEIESKYQVAVKELKESEEKVESMRVKLGFVGRNCEELKGEIEGLKGEKELILKENEELRKERNELKKEVSRVNEVVLGLREDEEIWRLKFIELERSNVEMVEKVEVLGREIENLMGEKLKVVERLSELEKELQRINRVKEEVLGEKNGLELVKSRHEDEISELQYQVNELQGNLAILEESNIRHLERIKELVSEIDDHKNALERVSIERDEARKSLDEEKMKGMELQVKVSEISKKMEETAKVIEQLRGASDTLVGEKKEVEDKCRNLEEEKGLAEKKFAQAMEKVAELEVLTRSKGEMFELALTMLRNTALQLSIENEKKLEDEGIRLNNEVVNGEMEKYLGELEVIRSAFKRREEKVGEMQREVESLQYSVMEAKKKKSFWTLVSSATTILAAVVSFAYAARVN